MAYNIPAFMGSAFPARAVAPVPDFGIVMTIDLTFASTFAVMLLLALDLMTDTSRWRY